MVIEFDTSTNVSVICYENSTCFVDNGSYKYYSLLSYSPCKQRGPKDKNDVHLQQSSLSRRSSANIMQMSLYTIHGSVPSHSAPPYFRQL